MTNGRAFAVDQEFLGLYDRAIRVGDDYRLSAGMTELSTDMHQSGIVVCYVHL